MGSEARIRVLQTQAQADHPSLHLRRWNSATKERVERPLGSESPPTRQRDLSHCRTSGRVGGIEVANFRQLANLGFRPHRIHGLEPDSRFG